MQLQAVETERKRKRDRAALARGEKLEDDPDSPNNPYGADDEGMKGGILIPLAPFGIPKYDNGERFDLKVRCSMLLSWCISLHTAVWEASLMIAPGWWCSALNSQYDTGKRCDLSVQC